MEAGKFLELVNGGIFSSINHHTYDDLKKLTGSKEKIVLHIAKENLNRRAPTTRQLYYGVGFERSVLRSLVKDGYLYDPSIMEIGKEFFERSIYGWNADEPIKSIFGDLLTSFGSRHGSISSWNKKFETPRASVYPRHYFAAVVADELPVYWPIIYQDPPVQIAPKVV